MDKSLPYIITQAQLKARSNPELKKFLKDTLKELNSIHNPVEQVKYTHKLIDKELEKSKIKTSCKKGCNFCCFHPIRLSNHEGSLLNKTSSTIDLKKLNKQVSQDCKSIEDTACVLLKRGICSNYSNRPIICRLTYVNSDPLNCDLKGEEKPISHIPVTRAALIGAAYYMLNFELIYLPESFT